MDALAIVYARELTRWGIETSIIVPGAFTSGTNHFANAGTPADKGCAEEYEAGPYKHFAEDIMKGFSSIVPPDADVTAVAEAIAKVVDAPVGKRPFRVHIDPTQDGAEVVNMVSDRVRAEFLRRIGLGDVLTLACSRRVYDNTLFKKWIACAIAARVGAESAIGFSVAKSWIVPLYLVVTTSTPALSNLRPYSSPSSRSTSFSEVMMSVRGDPASCSFDANNGEAVASLRRL
jgi:hypothetical protein